MQTPDVSIIVPTRDRPDALAGCLDAIEKQEGCGAFEIIVVDDGSKEQSRVAAIVARAPHASLIRLDGRGPAVARNAGAEAARAPILLFTDDDCQPRPTWAACLAETLRKGDLDAVGGGIVDIRPASPYVLAMRAMGNAFAEARGNETIFIGSLNMGCRADVFRDVPFDEHFPFASEDRDWSRRLIAKGYRMGRNLEALVMHTRQDSLADFLRRYERYGEGSYLFRKIHSGGRLAPTSVYAAGVRRAFGYGPRVGALAFLSQIATAIGFARAARADRPRSQRPRYDEDEV